MKEVRRAGGGSIHVANPPYLSSLYVLPLRHWTLKSPYFLCLLFFFFFFLLLSRCPNGHLPFSFVSLRMEAGRRAAIVLPFWMPICAGTLGDAYGGRVVLKEWMPVGVNLSPEMRRLFAALYHLRFVFFFSLSLVYMPVFFFFSPLPLLSFSSSPNTSDPRHLPSFFLARLTEATYYLFPFGPFENISIDIDIELSLTRGTCSTATRSSLQNEKKKRRKEAIRSHRIFYFLFEQREVRAREEEA